MSGGLLDIGEIILATTERRLEIVSRNIANASTAGFKKEIAFGEILSSLEATDKTSGITPNPQATYTDFSQGSLRMTGRAFDLALSGPGFFRVRSIDGTSYYTRNGEFERGGDGRLANAQGMVLQTAGGDDLVVADDAAEILSDGVVLEAGQPVARIGVFVPSSGEQFQALGGTLFSASAAPLEAGEPLVRQGMIETANIDMPGEMVGMMEALRSAEIGARIVQAYDGLIDKSISTFGRGSA